MAVSVGVDFGSTYTTISYLDENGEPKGISMTEDGTGDAIPTLVAWDQDEEAYVIGLEAKSNIGNDDFDFYSACKMLVAEMDDDVIRSRGYQLEGEKSPKAIATIFLEHVIREGISKIGHRDIDTIYIGVPEIWFQSLSIAGGARTIRNIARDILKINKNDRNDIKRVCVVSEPIAATAFFAHNYKNLHPLHVNFDGYMLLVDYGGGTLDIALTRVEPDPKDPSKVEIHVEKRYGEGENQQGTIGAAGISYLETVARRAMENAGMEIPDNYQWNEDFMNLVKDFEIALQLNSSSIGNAMSMAGVHIEGLTDENGDLLRPDQANENVCKMVADMPFIKPKFKKFKVAGKSVEVTYDLMIEVYNESICKVLARELLKVQKYMVNAGIPYMNSDPEMDVFKIAEVGGFCNYWLVRKQIQDTFHYQGMMGNDKRGRYIAKNDYEKTRAVSYGATLLANQKVSIHHASPIGIGVRAENVPPGWKHVQYAIPYGHKVDYDEPAWITIPGSKEPIPFEVSDLKNIWVNEEGDHTGKEIEIPESFRAKIREKLIEVDCDELNIAFSVDSSNVYSIYLYPAKEKLRNNPENRIIQELDNLKRMKIRTPGLKIAEPRRVED